MKIVSSSIKYFQSVEEEFLIKCDGMADFKDTLETMTHNGYYHDSIVKNRERVERFRKEIKKQLL